MMYEIVKQLSDAGFPQNPNNHAERPNSWVHKDGTLHDWVGAGSDLDEECYAPTLEELIEACGGHLDLRIRPNNCGAYMETSPGARGMIRGKGSTPNEAVAYLWLALNKKSI